MKPFFKYLMYVLRHKWYVFRECANHGIVWRGIVHDMSKFLPSEWFVYMRYFYVNKESNKHNFKLAFLKHQNRNPHHWQYWVDSRNYAYAMPNVYAMEMICDWIGAGKAQGKGHPTEVKEWYDENKFDMKLHKQTRRLVEDYIKRMS